MINKAWIVEDIVYRKQLVSIMKLNQGAWIADLTTEVGLALGPD